MRSYLYIYRVYIYIFVAFIVMYLLHLYLYICCVYIYIFVESVQSVNVHLSWCHPVITVWEAVRRALSYCGCSICSNYTHLIWTCETVDDTDQSPTTVILGKPRRHTSLDCRMLLSGIHKVPTMVSQISPLFQTSTVRPRSSRFISLIAACLEKIHKRITCRSEGQRSNGVVC